MKTLTELNSKWWWRLIKVIYLILMVLLSIFGLFLIYTTLQDNPYKENTDYSLTKSDPQLEEIMSQINFEHLSPDQEKYFEEIKPKIHEELKSISVNFSDLKKDFSKSDIKKIVELYDRFDLQVPGYQEYLKDESERTHNYELYEKTRFIKIGCLSILFLLSIYIWTILCRGAIYYIIFGKFNPEK